MDEKSRMPLQFILGIILALGAGVLMFFGVFDVSIRIAIGTIGLVLIATSKYRLL
ncbi:MAG: hypothetical protein HKN54_12965 [Flavobacteriaceae bacterium]|nr:hypothetical protein [Flavobacteriaceae bacterium]